MARPWYRGRNGELMPLSVSVALAVAIAGVWWVVTRPNMRPKYGPPQVWARTKAIKAAYDQWVTTADSVRCPDSIDVLDRDLGLRPGERLRDMWGTPYALRGKDPDAVAVVSAGPDRRFGTADDISSRDPRPRR